MTQDQGFNDLSPDRFDEILREIVSIEWIFSNGDIMSILREEWNNEVLEWWALENDRCVECGHKLDDEGWCVTCDGPAWDDGEEHTHYAPGCPVDGDLP